MDPAFARVRSLAEQTDDLPMFTLVDLPRADDPIVFPQLVTLMQRLADRRGERGVTVARVVRAAEKLHYVRHAASDPANTRAGSWRGRLGSAAGLVATNRTERVPTCWNPSANANRHTVWVRPMGVRPHG